MELKSGHTWSWDGFLGPQSHLMNTFWYNFALPLIPSLAGRTSKKHILQAFKQSLIKQGNQARRFYGLAVDC